MYLLHKQRKIDDEKREIISPSTQLLNINGVYDM